MTVNHDEQRARIAEVTAQIIAREGVDAATVRHIAAEVGCSTSIVTYYFANKQQLLISAYKSLHDELYSKFDAIVARDPSDLTSCLLCMTAADEVSLNRWRTYVALWGHAARDQSWAAKECEDLDFALARIEAVIRTRNGDIASIKEVSRDLNAFIQGISVQVLMNPESWPREKIKATVERMVDRLLGAAVSPGVRANT